MSLQNGSSKRRVSKANTRSGSRHYQQKATRKKTYPLKQNDALSLERIGRNHIRALLCLSGIAISATNVSWPDVTLVEGIVVIGAALYTLISYLLIKNAGTKDSYERVFARIATADAAVIAFILNTEQINLLPTLLFFIIVQFNGLIASGYKQWARDCGSFFIGLAITISIWQSQWVFLDNIAAISISIIATLCYFFTYAAYTHNSVTALKADNAKLIDTVRIQKIRMYKLANYLTPTVWKAINNDREESLKTERKCITVFFSDIKGFSSLSEELEAETLTDLLNGYFTEMSTIVAKYNGTIDKFIGDGLLILFGDSQSVGMKDDCIRCVSMAIEMRHKMKELWSKWYNQGVKKPLEIRMGIHTGFCTVGTFGTSHYMDYTVLGTNVNLAARLESSSKAGEILISHETWSLVKDVIMCHEKDDIMVKGFSQPIKVYQVINFRKDLGKNQNYYEENTQGFSMHLDLDSIRNYEKEKVIEALEVAADRLRDKVIS